VRQTEISTSKRTNKDGKIGRPPDWIDEAVASVPELARIDEVARVLRASRRTITRKIASGEIGAVGGGGGSAAVLIPRDSVRAYLATLPTSA